jgi:VanZ family protein
MWRYKAFLPAILWMGLIFYGSTDIGSVQHTSRIIGPLLRWFKPDIREETIHDIQACLRKTGHVSEYGVLAALVWWARRRTFKLSGWSWREVQWVLVWCALYAASDEIHQIFVPSRGPSVWDVLIDTGGAFAALLLVRFLGRERFRKEVASPEIPRQTSAPGP